jgi:uncharacterized membrane protein (UPF0136 family)
MHAEGNGMHLFEALLILFAGQLTLAVAVMGGGRPRGANLLPFACLVPLALHLAFEGARWQMIPAYLVTVALCVFGGVRFWGARPPGGKSAPARLLGIAGFLLLMASVAAAVVFPR